MGVEGISPAFDPSSRFEKPEAVAAPQKPEAKSMAPAPSVKSQFESKQVPNPAQIHKEADQGKSAKISRSAVELQALTDQMSVAREQNYLRSKIDSLDQSVVQVQQELQDVSNETSQQTLDIASQGLNKASYWEQLDLSEKTQKINQLKDKLRNLELQKSQYMHTLRDKVASGSYTVSGSDILKGMLDEWL